MSGWTGVDYRGSAGLSAKAGTADRIAPSGALERDDVPVRSGRSGDYRLIGAGSDPATASCCARFAIVEYWRCETLGLKSELTVVSR